MRFDDVAVPTNSVLSVGIRHWAWARLLGQARTSSNDGKRSPTSDRGGSNPQVDLVGALAELFLLETTLRAPNSNEAVEYMRHHLFNSDGGRGVVGPDMRYFDHITSQKYELDAKTFDCSPNKRFFAINNGKHGSLLGQCSHYLCVVTPPLGRRMAVARLIPYADVDRWQLKQLRPDGSPSRNLPIGEFLNTYFTEPPTLDEFRRDTYSEVEIETACANYEVRAKFDEVLPGVLSTRP